MMCKAYPGKVLKVSYADTLNVFRDREQIGQIACGYLVKQQKRGNSMASSNRNLRRKKTNENGASLWNVLKKDAHNSF